ncbi:trypsin-7-like [Homalodisca vitripennis]|uniref:trypsin-7-like n=1 Tax=Homalodisca vitripennis TaxID=197043 RepID=UPI001EEC543D|nr:trypsin-7-like [Homalodisca vitripennis]
MDTKCVSLVFFFILAATSVICRARCEFISKTSSTQENDAKLGIFHGHKTTIKKHPYLVALVTDGSLDCAGAIVGRSWVLTAGICGENVDPARTTVVAGSSDYSTGQEYQIQEVKVHPNYSQLLDYDYACVQVKGRFRWGRTVRPARLPQQKPTINTTMVVAGWGHTKPDEVEGFNRGLREGKMYWFNTTVCNFSFYNLTWSDRMSCAYNPGKTTLCTNDWGDPFINKGVVYGIFIAVSSTGYCTKHAFPVILADVFAVTSWINNTTNVENPLANYNVKTNLICLLL